jgi:hypothetical protein
MTYTRVIPRDFFNEAKLLKCFGKLSLSILDCKLPDGVKVTIEECGDPFEICLSHDGLLFIANYLTCVNGESVMFGSRYNSKRNFPFYCIHPESLEEIEVFTDDGKFSEEFVANFKQVAA